VALVTTNAGAEGPDGPDVVVSRVGLNATGDGDDLVYHGSYQPPDAGPERRVRAFSMASTACNIGTTPAEFQASHSGPTAGHHPVMTQGVFRLVDGRFEQVGMSWVRHFFCAINEPSCGDCQPTACSSLGVGCADTSWSALNSDPTTLGPHAQIDPWPGGEETTHSTFDAPVTVGQNSMVAGRIQITDGVIDETNAGGGRFVAEVLYVTHDESPAQRHNNASWREITLTPTSIAGAETGPGSVHVGEAALFAWSHFDPRVAVKPIDVPDDGRFLLGFRVQELEDGTWHYEYALYNMNSDRAGAGFHVPLPAGLNVTETGFHDVDYHSGDGLVHPVDYEGTDWPAALTDDSISWTTDSFATDPNANALRWSTLYNFRFRADAAPAPGSVTIDLFKPGGPPSVSVAALVPGPPPPACAADLDGNGVVDADDLVALLLDWGTDGSSRGTDLDGSGLVDVDDLTTLILAWGRCP
jgi:hypothetical protein